MEYSSFNNKKIILGITGCIAAYKSANLVREFVKLGADVRVVMTQAAAQFITPLTLSILSKNEVIVDVFPQQNSHLVKATPWHIDYALWGDLMLIAPCTVNTVAKIVYGLGDNAITTLSLALRCPLIIAPAADVDMYENKISQSNLQKAEDLGFTIVDADCGELASGLNGRGRMAEEEKIIKTCESVLNGAKKDLTGKRILITAGPTYEDIDPVRYIGNRSSGKMGFELAKAAKIRGAEVTLVSGPTHEKIFQGISLETVRSSKDMLKKVNELIVDKDYLIMSAAVADYTPKNLTNSKIKKEDGLSVIELKETDDILAQLNKKNTKVVGFALETDNELQNAEKKLVKKNLDMVVLNSLKNEKSGFEFDTNQVSIIKNNYRKDFGLNSKFIIANNILNEMLKI